MNLRPFFSYFGSKWNIAEHYYPRPVYGTIIEPFAGSASYAVRYYDRNIILIDKSPVIAGIWNYLINASSRDILMLPDPCGTDPIDDLHICQEAKWLIGFWCGRSLASAAKKSSGWVRRMPLSHQLSWGPRARRRLAHQVAFIRHWKIYEADYSSRHHDKKATYFIDPPYQKEGIRYQYSSRNLCYAQLAQWCRMLDGQVIVCENANARWLPFLPLKKIRSVTRNTFQEGMWCNETRK